MPHSLRVERFFEILATQHPRYGTSLIIKKAGGAYDPIHFLDSVAAYCECLTEKETYGLLRLLEAESYIKMGANDEYLQVLSEGFRRLDQTNLRAGPSHRGFVAMWFDPSMNEYRDNGFAKGIIDAGYDPILLQTADYTNLITDEIAANIRAASFVVADFSCEPIRRSKNGRSVEDWIVRGSVYYEAGFAMALGKPVFWTCRDACEKSLHFNIAQYPHLLWRDSVDLSKRLCDRIVAVIGWGPLATASDSSRTSSTPPP